LIKRHYKGTVCPSKARIDGKIVIITGANTGIGKETALELVKRGGTVYMACRAMDRAHLAANDIKRVVNIDDSRLSVLHLDLSSLESVRSFVREFKQRENKLDILINNAGIAYVPYGRTVDGFETTFGVNHLGPFLLTHLLMDLLTAGNSGSRIVNVASHAHKRCFMDINKLMPSKPDYSHFAAYCNSKLANVLFSRELARRLGSAASVYTLHPGVVATELFRYSSYIKKFTFLAHLFHWLTWPFLKDPWHGAQTTVYCAVDEKIASETGKYYSDCAVAKTSAQGCDDVLAKQLWDLSIKLVNLQPSEIHPLLQ
jgi:retinol dehydrogenase-13